jgi:nucleoside-diphosphate-sugar epimerase
LGVSSAKDRGILNQVASRALRGEELTIYSGGSYLRDYVYIDDVIDAFICAGIKTDAPIGAFNVASGKSVTIREAFELTARKVELFTGKPVRVTDVPWPSLVSKIETRDFVANIKKSTSILKWTPQVSLDYGMEKMIKHFDAINGRNTNA